MRGKLNNKRKGRTEKGITLVALVVTVVVLLILAGVSIVTLFGESGIITAAQKAKNLTEEGVTNDLAGLKELEWEMRVASGNLPEAEKGVIVNTKYAKYVENGKTAYIPGGYCVVKDSTTDTDTARKVNKISNGLVISDLANDTLDNEPNLEGVRGNQFVWVPVPDITSMYDEEHTAGKLYDYGTYNSSTRKWTAFANPTLKAYPTTKNSGQREPDVVTGKADGTGTSYDGSETNLNIITDFKVAEGQTKTATLFKDYLQKEFDKMLASVKKYKGFYIGRYETGNLSRTNNTVKAVVQKGNSELVGVNWYNIYQRTKNMEADNSNVTISMIWGCQWDRTLNWFIETGTSIADIVDSTAWGNHRDDTEEENGSRQSSGYSPAWQKNHIYDMAGNVREWTIEAGGYGYRVDRGGDCYTFCSWAPAAYRDYSIYPTDNGSAGNIRFSFHTLYKSVN